MILGGLIKAEKIERDNFISESEVRRLENIKRTAGQPKKEAVQK